MSNVPVPWRSLGWMAAVALVAGSGSRAAGKDFWLEADPPVAVAAPAAGKGTERALHLRTGDGFKADEERPLQKDRTGRFDLYADQARRRDLLATGQEGQLPVDKLPPEPSACLVVMDRRDAPSTVEADKFNRFLADEGLDAVLSQRTRLGQGGAEAHEQVSWFLKTLVPGQDSLNMLPNTFYKRRVEQRLELLLQNNPGRLPTNHRLAVKVLFEAKPLAGVKVSVYRHEIAGGTPGGGAGPVAPGVAAPASALTAVTSAQGLAEFKLEPNAEWLVRLVHVRPGADRKAGPGGAWEVFAAAYTFVTRDAPAAMPTPAIKPPTGGDGK